MKADTRFNPVEQANESAKPRRRWPRRLATGFVVVTLIFGLPFGAWYFSAKAARDAEIAKIRAAGEPAWFSELKPAPIDPAQDGMPIMRQAFAAMKPLPDEVSAQMRSLYDPDEEPMDPAESAKFMEAQGDIIVEPEGIKLRDWLAQHAPKDADEIGPRPPLGVREKFLVEKLRPLVAANQLAYELTDEAIERPRLSIQIDYDHPQPLWLVRPEQEQFTDIQELLEAKLRCHLQDADKTGTAKTLVSMIALAQRQHTATQASLFDVLISSANSGRCLLLLAEIMERGALDPTRIPDFDRSCSGFEELIRFRPAILGERAATLTTGDNFLEHGEHENRFVQSAVGKFFYQPFVWDNETNYLRAVGAMATYADRYEGDASRVRQEVYDREIAPIEDGSLSGYRTLSHMAAAMLVPHTAQVEPLVVDSRNRLRAARVGLRVDAYYREHGQLPTSLEATLGGPLTEVPMDVVNEEPLVLIVDDRSFAVCPASEAGREHKLLKKAIEARREKSPPMADDNEDPDQEDSARDLDEDEASSAFRVIYRAAPTIAEKLR